MTQTTAPTLRCYRWPSKSLYLMADAASLALREIFYERECYGPRLIAYQCWGADQNHWHLGNVRESGV